MATPGGSDGATKAEHLQPSTSTSSSTSSSSTVHINAATTEPISQSIGVLRKITDNFSQKRLLGQGTYGKVYKGIHENGDEIAVKLLYNNMQAIDDDKFQHEFDNLMMLNHKNIVRLVGYCYDTQRQHMDYQGRTVFGETTYRALCFEYMQMGSLQRHLSDETLGLEWQARYKIIKGTCKGLQYLHEGSKEPIYHLDLKPDNILLDKNMVPKLADFGLSKLFSEEQTRVTQSTIGTIGYMPREYLFGHVVSKKFDIFSLGVVITQIIAGPKGHTRRAEMGRQKFLNQVHANWRKRLEETCTSETLEANCQQVSICTDIGLRCMKVARRKRPSILEIINKLDGTETVIEKVTAVRRLLPNTTLDHNRSDKVPVSGFSASFKPICDTITKNETLVIPSDQAAQLLLMLRAQGNGERRANQAWDQLRGKLVQVATYVASPRITADALLDLLEDARNLQLGHPEAEVLLGRIMASLEEETVRALDARIAIPRLRELLLVVADQLDMVPLCDSDPVHMVDANSNFCEENVADFVKCSTQLSAPNAPYAVLSIVGTPISGKSYLLNHLFGTKFPVGKATYGWSQTTRGIMMSRCIGPSLLVLDFEGFDGRETGKDTLSERHAALFALTISDVMLVNMNIFDIGREHAGGTLLFKTIFKERNKLEAGLTKILVVLRMYDREIPLETLRDDMMTNLEEMWRSVNVTSMRFEDYIEINVVGLPDKNSESFQREVTTFRRLLSKVNTDHNRSSKVPASSFSASLKLFWGAIRKNKKLNIPSHQEALDVSFCRETAEVTIQYVYSHEDYKLLKAEESPRCFKEISDTLLKNIITMYDDETEMYDPKVRDNERQYMLEKINKVFVEHSWELVRKTQKNTLEQFKDDYAMKLKNMKETDVDLSYDDRIVDSCVQQFMNLCEDLKVFDLDNLHRACAELQSDLQSYIIEIAQLLVTLRAQGDGERGGNQAWDQLRGKLAQVATYVTNPRITVDVVLDLLGDARNLRLGHPEAEALLWRIMASLDEETVRPVDTGMDIPRLSKLLLVVADQLDMVPLCDSDPMHMVDANSNFCEKNVADLVKCSAWLSAPNAPYAVVSIVGSQTSGKSYLLNCLFGTKFPVMDPRRGRSQTTRGIMMSRCIGPSLLVLDFQGFDGLDRGQDWLFEGQASLFALTLSDVILFNMSAFGIGREQAGRTVIFKTIFKERNKLEAGLTKILVVVRFYDGETPLEMLREDLMTYLEETWRSANVTSMRFEDYFQINVVGLPDKNSESFQREVTTLRRLLSKISTDHDRSSKVPASSFAVSSKMFWDAIRKNKKLNIPSH